MTSSVVHSDPEIMSGTPVFVGTQVPFRALLDYLEGGQSLSKFLNDFPTVRHDQAVAALEEAGNAMLFLEPVHRSWSPGFLEMITSPCDFPYVEQPPSRSVPDCVFERDTCSRTP